LNKIAAQKDRKAFNFRRKITPAFLPGGSGLKAENFSENLTKKFCLADNKFATLIKPRNSDYVRR
jgi:hypothetical protein